MNKEIIYALPIESLDEALLCMKRALHTEVVYTSDLQGMLKNVQETKEKNMYRVIELLLSLEKIDDK